MIPRESEVQAVLETGKIIINSGLVSGTWGNISVRLSNPDSFLITPSGVPYHELTAEDLVIIDLQGEVLAGRLKPSSETPLHAAIYRAVIHQVWGNRMLLPMPRQKEYLLIMIITGL
jgi:L-ribulose-5-phosphate 4-epimerase